VPKGSRAIDTIKARFPVLDLGCGINKYPGAIGLDRGPNTRADIIADLDHFPYPIRDNSFGQVRAIHVVEHVSNIIRMMEELHRVLVPGGQAVIVTPHYTDFSSFCDPTHKWHLNSFSLRYFGPNHAGFGYYSNARFREISVHVRLLALWRYLGFEFLVNRFARFRRFWEYYLCYIVRGKVIEWQLEAEKSLPASLGDGNRSGESRTTFGSVKTGLS
jgi:SAM-dependent methyltransferase